MTDSHHLLEAWLVDGAVGDPPRELAVHASVCESCARRLGAFDSLATIDVNAAGSPPPLAPPTRVAVGLAWARLATAVAGTIVAGILVVFGATQLAGFVGSLDLNPGPSGLMGLATPTGNEESPGPDPAVEPSITEPTPTPIPSFIPLPSLAPQATPLQAPSAPFLSRGGVTQTTIAMSWFDGAGGGPVQKWEIWRQAGSGPWIKLGELFPYVHTYTNGGLTPSSSYAYRIRPVNASWFGPFSNTMTATTLALPPTPAPTPTATPTPTPDPTPSLSEPPTPTPTPDPTPTPTPEPSLPPPSP